MEDDDIKSHLGRVERQLNEILSLLHPVNVHAEWVDGLRDTLHRWKVLPRGGNNLITEN